MNYKNYLLLITSCFFFSEPSLKASKIDREGFFALTVGVGILSYLAYSLYDNIRIGNKINKILKKIIRKEKLKIRECIKGNAYLFKLYKKINQHSAQCYAQHWHAGQANEFHVPITEYNHPVVFVNTGSHESHSLSDAELVIMGKVFALNDKIMAIIKENKQFDEVLNLVETLYGPFDDSFDIYLAVLEIFLKNNFIITYL